MAFSEVPLSISARGCPVCPMERCNELSQQPQPSGRPSIFGFLYFDEAEHPVVEVLRDVTNHQIETRLRLLGEDHAGGSIFTVFSRKSHGFYTISSVRPGVAAGDDRVRRGSLRRRVPSCWIDPEVQDIGGFGFGWVKNKGRGRRYNLLNIVNIGSRLEHNGLVEPGHKKVHNPT